MANTISNSDDLIDSRDVIERIAELTDERQSLADEVDAAVEWFHHDGELDVNGKETEHAEYRRCRDELTAWDEGDEGAELKALTSLAKDAEGYADDWRHGCTLIRDSYFVEYCEEMLKDIGDLPQNLPGYIAIDWEKTADNLRVDYTGVEFDGVTYWVR